MRHTVSLREGRTLFSSLLLSGVLAWSVGAPAADNNIRINRPVDNWQVDGENGVLYVSGSLTESPCRLSMMSASQTVDMGNIESASLPYVGAKGQPIPFQISLLDCIETNTLVTTRRTGETAWSPTQPAVKIRFLAPTVPFMPQYAQVTGAQGIGLELSNTRGQPLPLNEQSNPVLLASGQDVLTYYITPVRTAADMLANAYSALITFEMLYE
ncbi:fimbrial protein [Providencia stuartii]|uniref:fimbrial protein n=1 Tax=Providencia stuartii TaxID=588 RepID=UPI0024AA65BC|nr:fimbrial protein [Providencia stuartii]MCX3071351.1 fimbrial protein [Providencia stuartii]